MSTPSPLIWFLLLDSSTGKPYKNTTATSVLRSSLAVPIVDHFRDAVKANSPNKLSFVDSADLLVYKNKSAFVEGKEKPLKSSCPLDGHGITDNEEDLLVVVVPSSSSSSTSPTRKEPHPKRKQRWVKLSDTIQGNAKTVKAKDSTAYAHVSDVTWNDVKRIFNPKKYVQERRNIDDDQLSILKQYLSITTKCFGNVTTGNDAKRLHFIAPVLICVCILFDGDVEILVEEDLVGNFVKAHSHFEFMLRRKNKVVCIVEAKKDDLEQGMAEVLVGCEVAAEIGGLDIVYGIVTNYFQWNFLRRLDDKVEMEECSLSHTPEGPERDSLKSIAEKIYAMLSN